MNRYILAHDLAHTRALDHVRKAPQGWHVLVQEPKRSGAQNAALHARLTEIAAQRQWAGKWHDVFVWKRLMIGAWSRATNRHAEMLPALDGQGFELIWRSSTDLSERECGELLEFINAWDAMECEA
jgi:hypothetical protein